MRLARDHALMETICELKTERDRLRKALHLHHQRQQDEAVLMDPRRDKDFNGTCPYCLVYTSPDEARMSEEENSRG